MIWRIIFSGSSARSSRSVTLAAMMSRVREKIPILLNSCRNAVRNYASAGAGQGGVGTRHKSGASHRADHRRSSRNVTLEQHRQRTDVGSTVHIVETTSD